MTPAPKNPVLIAALRAGFFIALAIVAINVFVLLFELLLGSPAILVVSALGTFAGAAVASAVLLRIYARGRFSDIGLPWNSASRRNLSLGLLGGIGAALAVLLIPVLARAAAVEPEAGAQTRWGGLAFITIVLVFGAVGEELLFRGYAFQVLMRELGPFATILPAGIIFGIAHIPNRNATFLAIANTALWGILLGFAFVRSGDLWLPIGLHFGWNWALPLLGANLSGFTINLTGYALHWKAGPLWSGGMYGPEGGLPAGAAAVALFFYLYSAPVRTQKPYLLRGSIGDEF